MSLDAQSILKMRSMLRWAEHQEEWWDSGGCGVTLTVKLTEWYDLWPLSLGEIAGA